MTGTVYLIGAGPGDAELVTVKGLEIIRRADCILYDRLAPPGLLSEAKPGCECVFVGKEPGHHTLPQDKLQELLLQKAKKYSCVVRLKGGDPYVFGRGGEEGAFLAEHGIYFVVVPGVSAVAAAPASAGIPLTHRGLAESFRVINAHPRADGQSPDYASMRSESETLVFLMGLSRVEEIAQGLIAAGRRPETPVAVISGATTSRQRVCAGTLSDIAGRVRAERLTSPATIVVGAVVSLRETLAGQKPRRCLVPKIGEEPSRLGVLLRQQGFSVDELPVGQIVRIPTVYTKESLRRADWLVFTSQNGAACFLENLFDSGMDVRALANARIAAVGRATESALVSCGLRADLIPEEQSAEALASALLPQLEGNRLQVWYPCAEKTGGSIERLLALHCELLATPVYRNEKYNQELICECPLNDYDAILFTCASNVERLLCGRPKEEIARLNERTCVYSIGESTSMELRKWGVWKLVQAERADYEGLAHALREEQICSA